ncbi:nuclease-related domain-containing protein [Pseudazoarcus pumilus]|uniref:Nuclease n=1 Tax=Pseudazoarcus pumilus TaxID=2067960 RepID=A0A2I6S9Y5_9RHOO|nr:nuclease-related domain-containing protein [Pseudazoarcus pumilus]AUN96064.1 nuclease [Pseudazoarcus pumilus]
MSLILLFALFVFPPLVVAGTLLQWRRRRMRAARKSPLTSDLLRPPGQRLREQLDALGDEVDLYLMMVVVGPTLVFAALVAPAGEAGAISPMSFGVAIVLVVLVVGYSTRKLLKFQREQDRLRVGYDAELAVGQELDQLMRQGAAVFHDFPADKFNIDHVVISPVGVFAVETKGRAKPILEKGKAAQVEYDGKALKFPTWIETEPIAQAERQAIWLRNWLTSATGEPIAVRAVLAIPGWYVKRTGRGAVNVYSGRELATLVSRGGFDTIAEDKMQRIIHQVEQRCRTIEPTFNRSVKK